MSHPDALTKSEQANYNTFLRAAGNGDLALMSCHDKRSGLRVPIICAVSQDADGTVTFTPLAQLLDGTQYEWLDPPT